MNNAKVILHLIDGNVAVTIPGASTIEELVEQIGSDAQVVDAESLPGGEFRDAWRLTPSGVEIDMAKAKEIAHAVRRQRREEEFKPHDDLIIKQIPGTDIPAVEAKRQKIRDKYAQVQVAIDAATTPDELKALLAS